MDLSARPEQQVEAAPVAVAELHAAVEAIRLAGARAREVRGVDGAAEDDQSAVGGPETGAAAGRGVSQAP